MPDGVRPVVIGGTLITKMITDPKFFDKLPEFNSVRHKALPLQNPKPGGCSGCQARKIVMNVSVDFTRILTSLSPDGIRRIKEYLGTQAMLVNTLNPKTGSLEVKVL